jgi:hypothetical protein
MTAKDTIEMKKRVQTFFHRVRRRKGSIDREPV